jgi:membrane protease subunit (stomatin/prohibitin family)
VKARATADSAAADARATLHGMSVFLEIIEWTGESRDTLSYRFPDDDRAINSGARLIVHPSQTAQFVYLGQFGDTFGPGTHTLVTDNIPILKSLKGWKYGFQSPFKADVYFVATRLFAGNTWGTTNPIMLRDADLGPVRVRAFGTYDFHIVDVKRFLAEVAGTDDHFHLTEFASVMRSRIVSAFSTALGASGIPVLEVAGRYGELGSALLPLINPILTARYGIEVPSFVVENVSVPAEVEAAIDKAGSLRAVQNLNDYVKYQIANSAQPGGAGSGIGGLGAELAVGLSVAQQMMAQSGAPGAAAAQAGSAAGAFDILKPADVAALLKTSEANVIASLEAGSLKGTRIGNEWRVTRAALEQFLR